MSRKVVAIMAMLVSALALTNGMTMRIAQAQGNTPVRPANLVLITSDTPVLTGPNGQAIANTLIRRCQTAYVIEKTENGQFVRLDRFGWIAAGATADVPENYGQRNGTPIDPSCGGGAPVVSASTPVNNPPLTTGAATSTVRINPANLVVLTSDAPILNVPNGQPVAGALLRRCQTAFEVEKTADGQFVRLFRFGWVSAAAVGDVAEDYGQRNGTPKIAGC